jgi:proteic killer suppression protein
VCTNAKAAEREYGNDMAVKIHQRIDEISAADSIDILIKFKIGGCHSLKGDRKNQYAMTLIQPYRLIFELKNDEVKIIRVIEIVDYH